jgi:glycosyltransferase involved in cell wall biosynthesis
MKIAFVSEHASPLATLGGIDSGGQNVYVAQVARQLARAGHTVDIFTRRDRPDLPTAVPFAPNVRVIHIPAGPPRFVAKEALLPWMQEFSERIAAYCVRYPRYDLVHANFFMSGLAALRLRRTYGIPFVITFHALGKVRLQHQGSADSFPPERLGIEENLAIAADRIIAECPQDREDLIRLYGADPARIEVVPCGVNPEELGPGRDGARRRLGLAEDEFVVLQLGRLVPRKGIDNVIHAVGTLKRNYGITARLLVVGGESEQPDPLLTPEIGRLSAVAEVEGVRSQVVFTGQRPRHLLRDYYCAADVFVTTPWYEPFGITPLEAMACGCPVIGSAVCGIKYSVVDSVTGYLVPPRDPAQLAERLARLFANPELGRALGRAGICRVRSEFTWSKVAAELMRIYAEVAAPLQPPAHSNRFAAEVARS